MLHMGGKSEQNNRPGSLNLNIQEQGFGSHQIHFQLLTSQEPSASHARKSYPGRRRLATAVA